MEMDHGIPPVGCAKILRPHSIFGVSSSPTPRRPLSLEGLDSRGAITSSVAGLLRQSSTPLVVARVVWSECLRLSRNHGANESGAMPRSRRTHKGFGAESCTPQHQS